jgi:hypothetical protein
MGAYFGNINALTIWNNKESIGKTDSANKPGDAACGRYFCCRLRGGDISAPTKNQEKL